jgi:hypothetical protein
MKSLAQLLMMTDEELDREREDTLRVLEALGSGLDPDDGSDGRAPSVANLRKYLLDVSMEKATRKEPSP